MAVEYVDGDYISDTHWLTMREAIKGNAILSGMAVTPNGTQPPLEVDIAAGVYYANKTRAVYAGGSQALNAAHGTYDRWDIITGDAAGTLTYTAGTAAAIPHPPDLPANEILITAIYVPATITAIIAAMIHNFGFWSEILEHASRHEDGGDDELEITNLATAETDTTKLIRPDGTGGVEWTDDIIEIAIKRVYDYSGDMSSLILPLFPWSAPTKLASPATLPGGAGHGAEFSPNGEYLAIAHTGTPFVTIYQRNENTFTKLADPGYLPADDSYGCAWTTNGEFLAVAHETDPFVTIYQRVGNVFTKLADPANKPAGNGQGCAWSPNGMLLAVAHVTDPYITVYSRAGTTFTKLANPATKPTGDGYGCAFSPNGHYLAIAHNTTPIITI